MSDPLRIARVVATRCAFGAALMWTSIFSLKSCVAPYSAASYRDHDTEVLWATICHDGKHTIGVPADEWPDHKAHGDYRGPCRNLGHPGPEPPRVVDETLTAYEGGKRRAKLSQEAFARQQAALQVDSTTAARGRARQADGPQR